MNRVHVVGCCYGMTPDEFVDLMNKVGDKLGIEWAGLVVDNAPFARPMQKVSSKHQWEVQRGTNEDLDFSAYFQGAAWLANKDAPYGVFANDSLFRLHAAITNMRAVACLLPLLGQLNAPAIVGKTDSYHSLCLQNPWSGLDKYVSTYCFALNRASLGALTELSTLAAADGLGEGTALVDAAWGAGLAAPFREFLRANLSYTESPYSWTGFERHRVDDQLLRRKARCIYFEHRLSGEIGRVGCILPTNAGNKMRLLMFITERLASLRSSIAVFHGST